MLVVIRGAGDIATGIALRLFSLGHKKLVVMTDLPQPTSIRRTVCFFRGHPPRLRDGRGVEAVLAKRRR